MKQINLGIIGTGWCGGIRAETARASALIKDIHIAETNELRLKEMADLVGAKTATTDYRELLKIDDIDPRDFEENKDSNLKIDSSLHPARGNLIFPDVPPKKKQVMKLMQEQKKKKRQ
jgi:hypothetical protein